MFLSKSRKIHIKAREKGDHLGFLNIHSVAKYQNIEGGEGLFGKIKKFRKKSSQCRKKNRKAGPSSVIQYCMIR